MGVYETQTPKSCATCGKPTTRRDRKNNRPRCLDCAIAVASDAARSMHNKNGAVYGDWLSSMLDWMTSYVDKHNAEANTTNTDDALYTQDTLF